MPDMLVMAEARQHHDTIERMLRDLEARRHDLASTAGKVVVLDTHVLLHYKPPEQVAWTDILSAKQVRLVLPLRVVEELDAKKYSGNRVLADRARRFLPQLEAMVGNGGRVQRIREGVTIEVAPEPLNRFRPVDADAEILGFCAELAQLTERGVILMTADTGTLLRAQAHRITAQHPPESELRVPLSDDAEAQT